MPILKIILIIYSRQKESVMQQEIYIDQCNQVRAEDKTAFKDMGISDFWR